MKACIGVALVIVAVIGCQAQQKPAAQAGNLSVLDVSAPSPAYHAASYAPSSQAPAVPAASVDPAATAAPVPGGAPAAAGANYTVKKGDTLFHIAKEHYGDGKQWRRIAAANPGVTATSLKVGQILVMP